MFTEFVGRLEWVAGGLFSKIPGKSGGFGWNVLFSDSVDESVRSSLLEEGKMSKYEGLKSFLRVFLLLAVDVGE